MVRTDPDASAQPATAGGVIAIVDPSRLRRECLKLALEQHAPQRHITDAGNAEELLNGAAAGGRIDLVLVGAATADHIELRQIETLRRMLPDTPLVVVAETDNPQRARQILSTGARGFLPASLSLRVLIGALDLVLAGGVYVPSSLIDGASNHASSVPDDAFASSPWSELTRRQRDVLGLVSQGRSNKLIADALSMSESTVKAHVKQIIKRLNVANRTQAALVATGRGYFGPSARAGNGAAGHAL